MNITIHFFQLLFKGEDVSTFISQSQENRQYNRFAGIYSCKFITGLYNDCIVILNALSDDTTRVTLNAMADIEGCQHDYINANFVDVCLVKIDIM